MENGFERKTRKVFGIFLVLGCMAGIFYSSYRIEMGFTDIGLGFIEFIKRMAVQWQFSAEWNLDWLEVVLQKIVQIVAFILLGFFVSASFTWWGIAGRRRMWLVALTVVFISVADEGFQSLVLQGEFSGLDLIWDLAGAFAGYEILRFKEITNRE